MLKENEKILKEDKANYFNSKLGMAGMSAGGKLYLTNQRILFEGHGFNIGREAIIVHIKNIVSCTTGFPNTLTILTENNEEFKFAVSDKSEWQNMIMSAVRTKSYQNGSVELSKEKSAPSSLDYENSHPYVMRTFDEDKPLYETEKKECSPFVKFFLCFGGFILAIIIIVCVQRILFG